MKRGGRECKIWIINMIQDLTIRFGGKVESQDEKFLLKVSFLLVRSAIFANYFTVPMY